MHTKTLNNMKDILLFIDFVVMVALLVAGLIASFFSFELAFSLALLLMPCIILGMLIDGGLN